MIAQYNQDLEGILLQYNQMLIPYEQEYEELTQQFNECNEQIALLQKNRDEDIAAAPDEQTKQTLQQEYDNLMEEKCNLLMEIQLAMEDCENQVTLLLEPCMAEVQLLTEQTIEKLDQLAQQYQVELTYS